MHRLLEESECDVLLLYDCCHPIFSGSGLATRGVTEALVAGGYEAVAAEVGPDSFTSLVIQELALAAQQKRPISVSEMHFRILTTLRDYQVRILRDGDGKLVLDPQNRPCFEPPRRRTPVHYFLHSATRHQSILLSPLLSKDPDKGIGSGEAAIPSGQHTLPEQEQQKGHVDSPHILVAARLNSASFSQQKWLDWLLKAPQEVQDILVQGWQGHFANLGIIRMPAISQSGSSGNASMSFFSLVASDTNTMARRAIPAVEVENVNAATAADAPTQRDNRTNTTNASLFDHRSERNRNSKRQPLEINPQEDHPSYSCPYRKRNPIRFNIRDHLSCATQSFPDISQVK